MKVIRNAILIIASVILMAAKAHAAADTFSLYFATGVTKLNNRQQAALDSLMYDISIGPNSSFRIIGYADEPGAVALNQHIGQNRAQSVMNYMLSSGFRKQSIVQCIGRGNLIKTGSNALQRRVDIVLISESPALSGNTETQTRSEGERGLDMLPAMRHNEVLVLEGLQFAVSTSEFLPESYPILKKLVAVLQAHPSIKIKIEGHICCGTDPKSGLDYFYSLSVDRARHVRDYLVAHHISADRLSCGGFGFLKPRVFPERSERDRFRNRRVELRVISD